MKTNPTASTDIQGEPDAEEQIEVEESESITNIEERLKEVRPTKEGSQEVLDEKKNKFEQMQTQMVAIDSNSCINHPNHCNNNNITFSKGTKM